MLLTLGGGGGGGGGNVQRGVLCTCHARGVWGHGPPGKLDPLRSLLVHFQVNLHYLLHSVNHAAMHRKKTLATKFEGGGGEILARAPPPK